MWFLTPKLRLWFTVLLAWHRYLTFVLPWHARHALVSHGQSVNKAWHSKAKWYTVCISHVGLGTVIHFQDDALVQVSIVLHATAWGQLFTSCVLSARLLLWQHMWRDIIPDDYDCQVTIKGQHSKSLTMNGYWMAQGWFSRTFTSLQYVAICYSVITVVALRYMHAWKGLHQYRHYCVFISQTSSAWLPEGCLQPFLRQLRTCNR